MKYFRSEQYPIKFVLSENINKEFSSHNHANHYINSCLPCADPRLSLLQKWSEKTISYLRESKVRIIVELARKISERTREPEQSREA